MSGRGSDRVPLLLAGIFASNVVSLAESSAAKIRTPLRRRGARSLPSARQRRGRLEVSDAAPDVGVLGVARGVPEGSRVGVGVCHECGDTTHAAVTKVFLSRPGQPKSDALAPIPVIDCEPVDVSSPAVPARDNSTYDGSAGLRDKEGGRRLSHQWLDVLSAIRHARVLATSLRPECQHPIYVIGASAANGDLLGLQARECSGPRPSRSSDLGAVQPFRCALCTYNPHKAHQKGLGGSGLGEGGH
jgi:hypothetical protein